MDRGYARISLDTERSGSIEKQRSRIAGFAGGEVEWYADESVSGSKVPFNDRPEGGRLMADLRSGDRVLITKIDRAARSVRDLLNIVERIEGAGASIVFVDQNIDTSGPMGRFILTLLGAIAELEASIIAERRRESLEQFAKEGRHAVGKAPFGFESVPNMEGRGLVIRPHPEEGPLLKHAIEQVLSGVPQSDVAAAIGMSPTGFHSLLRNPRLAGMTPDKGGVVTIPGKGPRIDPDAAILSMAEWTRLQDLMTARGEKGWQKHEGIGSALTCATCGDRLYFQTSKRNPAYATYKCRGVRPGTGHASVIAANAEAHVERTFLDRFGDTQGVLHYWEGSEVERAEAVSLARTWLRDVRHRQDSAMGDDEEEALMVEYLAAKRALREAEAIPSTRTLVSVPLDKTLREQSADEEVDRVSLLGIAGTWVVQPGRLPIEQKIELVEAKPDLSGIMAGLSAPETKKAPRQ